MQLHRKECILLPSAWAKTDKGTQTSCKERREIREKKKATNTLAWKTIKTTSDESPPEWNRSMRLSGRLCRRRTIANNRAGIELNNSGALTCCPKNADFTEQSRSANYSCLQKTSQLPQLDIISPQVIARRVKRSLWVSAWHSRQIA